MEKKAFNQTFIYKYSVFFIGIFMLISACSMLYPNFGYVMSFLGPIIYLIFFILAIVAITNYFSIKNSIDFNPLKISSLSFSLYIINTIFLIVYPICLFYVSLMYNGFALEGLPFVILGVINSKIIFKLLQKKYNDDK